MAFNWRLAVPELAMQIEDSDTRLILAERELEPLLAAALGEMAHPPEVHWID